jgi:hypothetical protein
MCNAVNQKVRKGLTIGFGFTVPFGFWTAFDLDFFLALGFFLVIFFGLALAACQALSCTRAEGSSFLVLLGRHAERLDSVGLPHAIDHSTSLGAASHIAQAPYPSALM